VFCVIFDARLFVKSVMFLFALRQLWLFYFLRMGVLICVSVNGAYE